MRLAMLTTAVACALGAGGLNAQQDAAPEERRAHDVYVLRGCLEGPEGIEEFMLTGATADGPAPPATEAEPDEAEPDEPESGEAAAPQMMTYQLRPVSGIHESGVTAEELRMHVGSLVEVTVRPPDPAPGPAPSPGVTRARDATAPDAVTEPAPRIYSVSALRPQGGECR